MKKPPIDKLFKKNHLIEEKEVEKEKIKEVEKKVIKSYTMRTRGGKNGREDKINQDSFLANYNLNGDIKTHLFGVYDGHGNKKFLNFF